MGKEAKYVVRLSTEERGQLENLVARGRVPYKLFARGGVAGSDVSRSMAEKAAA